MRRAVDSLMRENAQRRIARLVEGDEIEVFDVALHHRPVVGEQRVMGVAEPVEDTHFERDAHEGAPDANAAVGLPRWTQ